MIDLMRGALTLVAVAAGFGAFWSGILALLKQRASGRRYWLINPAAQIEGLFSKESGISLACMIVAIAAAMLAGALH